MKAHLILALALGVCSLLPAADLTVLKAELTKAEADFCADVQRDGLPEGFIKHIAPDGVLLIAGYELRGAAAVHATYGTERGPKITWTPVIVDVAASGDLGYTTGTFEIVASSENGAPPTTRTGRYMTVWKRQPDGKWKYVLDGGNLDSKPATPSGAALKKSGTP